MSVPRVLLEYFGVSRSRIWDPIGVPGPGSWFLVLLFRYASVFDFPSSSLPIEFILNLLYEPPFWRDTFHWIQVYYIISESTLSKVGSLWAKPWQKLSKLCSALKSESTGNNKNNVRNFITCSKLLSQELWIMG